MLAVDLVSWALLLLGSFFCLVGAIGLLRLPDMYARLHASGIVDTMGASLILLGLMLQAGLTLVTVKLVFILFFLFVTSPTAAHALAQAAQARGVEPMLHNEEGETLASSST